MRKLAVVIFFSLFCSTALYGDGFGEGWWTDDDFNDGYEEYDDGSLYAFSEGWELQVRGAGYLPCNQRWKDIYGTCNFEVQLEAAKMVNRNWGIWFNSTYYPNTGHSIGLGNFTRISFLPFSIGLKWLYCLTDRIDFYMGAGIAVCLLDIEDRAPILTHIHSWGQGWLVKAGFRYDISNRFFVDLFTDYLFQQYDYTTTRCDVERLNTDAGGLSFGLGIGFKI